MGKTFPRKKRWVLGIIKENLGNVMQKGLIDNVDTSYIFSTMMVLQCKPVENLTSIMDYP